MSTTEDDVKNAIAGNSGQPENNPWPARLQSFTKFSEQFHRRGTEIERRYEDARDDGSPDLAVGLKKANLFFSNVAVTKLRAVQPGEAPTVPASISEAVANGSSRDVLAAMRRALARKLDDGEVSSNAIASAYKELRELDRLIRSADADRAAEEASSGNGNQRRSFDATAI